MSDTFEFSIEHCTVAWRIDGEPALFGERDNDGTWTVTCNDPWLRLIAKNEADAQRLAQSIAAPLAEYRRELAAVRRRWTEAVRGLGEAP